MFILSILFGVSFVFLVGFAMALLAGPGLVEEKSEECADLEDV